MSLKKLLDFFDFDMLRLIDIERFLFDRQTAGYASTSSGYALRTPEQAEVQFVVQSRIAQTDGCL
jgi:hypothetical protein